MQNNKQIKLVFLGSANFSVPILTMLIEEFNVVAVVTEIDKKGGRNNKIIAPPVKQIAEKFNISCLQPASLRNNKDIIAKLIQFDADIFIVAAYGKILPIELLAIPKHGCLNIHPSLLPKYRGASPIQSCLLNGDKRTGATIILMDSGMDTGDIVAQEELLIDDNENYISLSARLADLSQGVLKDKLPKYLAGEIGLRPQIDSDATFCGKINKEDGRIDWTLNVDSVCNKIQAFSDWPGTFTTYNGKKLDIITAKIKNNQLATDYSPGKVFTSDDSICVQCLSGALELMEVKLEAKSVMKIKDFVNGHRDFIGAQLV